MGWITLEEEIGAKGTEGGVVLRDEEYDQSCRATLERCQDNYVVTCGIYGSMVHTAFFGEEDYEARYEEMKRDLQQFIDRVDGMADKERYDFYATFCDKY